MTQHEPAPVRSSTEPPGAIPPPREIPSNQLLQGAREIHIRHEGVVYRLRLTRNGKLILHK
ncbi:MAG TPA: hemin uptake protein HemP [Planctomycetaceae bacterium]|nr:hemin uptake protein HemP [Planctomycetaceae bacterium]